MDFFDAILTATYLKKASLSLLLDSLPQSVPPTYTSGKEMLAAALTGRIRTDASMLRQGAKNATEGANIATLIATSTSTVRDNLNQMLTLAQEVKADPTKGSVNGAAFTALAGELSSVVSGTKYNNISLLDKTGWTNDSRLTISGDGKSSTFKLQMGYGSSTFTLNDLSYLNYLKSVDLSSGSLDIDALISDLSTQINTVDVIYSRNNSLSGSYTSEANVLVEQADILKKAAEDAMPSEEDPLLRDIGSIISTTS